MEPPPRDAEAWSEERWLDWLNAPENQPVEAPPALPRPSGARDVLGAAMMGLERAMFGRVARPEVVIESEADGDDDDRTLWDEDDPRATTIAVDERPPRLRRGRGGPAAGRTP